LTIRSVGYLRPRTWQRTFYGAGAPDNLQRDPRAWAGLAPFSLHLALQTALHARRWDAVISHWALPCALAGALRPPRCRHLSVLHSADVHTMTQLPGRTLLASAVVASAGHHWFTSRALRDKFATCLDDARRQHLLRNSTCQPMGVDPPPALDARETLRARLGLSNFTALVLGRLVPVKGVEHAIAAVTNTGAQLVIVGDGPQREQLQALARPLGSQVRFIGVVTGRAKSEWLTAADVLLLPSVVLPSGRTEGVPTVAIEAMSHGCPVIASDVGGVRDLIQHDQNGWLVPQRDELALRRAVQSLISDPLRRGGISAQAVESTRQQHWDRVAETWESILARG
jgi:glycosyltransferase involved in cell wall biosynthesis